MKALEISTAQQTEILMDKEIVTGMSGEKRDERAGEQQGEESERPAARPPLRERQ